MTGLFVDTANLYFCVGKRFTNRKLDYQKIWDRVFEIAPIFKAFAYGVQMKSEATGFIARLSKIGFQTKYKQHDMIDDKIVKDVNWNVGITIDLVKLSPRINTVVLCSADAEMLPTIQWAKDQHFRVCVLACGIPIEIRDLADVWIEITEDLLEIRHGTSAVAK